MTELTAQEISRVFRAEYGRAVAVLVRRFGDIDVAEEAVQDAFAAAVERWPRTGTPPSPAGWIITTARNRAVDRLRRESVRDQRHAQAALLSPASLSFRESEFRVVFVLASAGSGRITHMAEGIPVAVACRLAWHSPRDTHAGAVRRVGHARVGNTSAAPMRFADQRK